VWRQRIATPQGDYDAILAAMAGLVRQADGSASRPFTVGIGTPGSATPDG
jgi:fructokinase